MAKLSREAVLDAALRLLEQRGADRLTLRALADALGVTPMAIYKYVQNKDDLLGGVIERLGAELPPPTMDGIGGGEGWKVVLAEQARQLRCFLLRHRDVVRLIVTPPVVGPASLVSLEFTARVFQLAGFTAANAATATTLYNNAVVGGVVWEILRTDYEEQVVGKTRGTERYWKFDYTTLDVDSWAGLAGMAEELGEQTNDQQFELALDSSLEMIDTHAGPDPDGIGFRAPIYARPVKTTETSKTVRRLAEQGHLIGDTWRTSGAGGTYEHRYAATGEVQAEVGLAGADDVDAAVAAARSAQPAWAAAHPVGARRRPVSPGRPARAARSRGRRARGPGQRHPDQRDEPRVSIRRRGSATTRDGATSSTAS